MKKNKEKQTSASIMLRHLLKMMVTFTLLFSLAIILAISHQLLTEVATNSEHITHSLKKTKIDSDHDWHYWRKNSTLDTSYSYVYVHNVRKNAAVEHYFSPKADDILAIKPIKVPLISNLYFRPGFGLLYHRLVYSDGIYYTLWQSLSPQLAVLNRIILVTLAILVLTLITTPLYIKRLTRRLTDPLTELSEKTKLINSLKEPGTSQLPVPVQPSEVTDLATNFNDLLTVLGKRQEQKEIFILNAAHELRTPIATIRSNAQLIERHGHAHPEIIDQSVAYITEESRAMQQLIDNLLTQIRANQLVVDFQRVDLTVIIQETINKVQKSISQPIIFNGPASLAVTSHGGAIEQILTNFIMNAGKYSPTDQPILINLNQDDSGTCTIAVQDNGSGIKEADKAHVFEHFFRSDEVRSSVPGTGLGLPISAHLAQVIDGTITIRDNHPQGTIFQLSLPATPNLSSSSSS
ncbi:sensor histidine kinase [Fructobacillus ficulneus]|uniref:histidine kinase n=1 Tax=Fructobacillus ficulneus TaxID=157463 RepID=A0A0K8MJB5_9LACO|nr:HAMP domain-containing sensor histidine kinase [Fructobacillus ficulneus]GAP00548.1 signal transduction histidine kinase [Fructobacillus ficulneus]